MYAHALCDRRVAAGSRFKGLKRFMHETVTEQCCITLKPEQATKRVLFSGRKGGKEKREVVGVTEAHNSST